MRRPVFALALFCLVAMIPVPALGGPPFRTDDPEPVEFKHWEVYIASIYQDDKDGIAATAPHLEVNYGIFPEFQLHFIFPLEYVKPEGSHSHYGYGDTEIGLKFRFFDKKDSEESEWMVGTFPILQIPTGSESKGLGNGDLQFFIPVWLQRNMGPWTTYGGGGYTINPGDNHKDFWFVGWLVQREINKNFTLGAEIFHETAREHGGDSNTGFNVGGTINLSENHHILLSAGRDIDGPNRFSSYIGYQFTFGPEKEKEPRKPH